MPKEIRLDPTAEEARHSDGCLTVANVPALGLVTNVWQTGQMDLEKVDQVSTHFPLISSLPHILRSVWTLALNDVQTYMQLSLRLC